MRYLRLIIFILICVLSGYLTFRTYQSTTDQRAVKEALIELSRVKYGLFSVEEWKGILARIISGKIEEFDFEEGNREKLRENIESFLYDAIEGFEERYHEKNSKSLGGLLRRGGASLFNIFGELREDVPVFTEQILSFMEEPQNRAAVEAFILKQLEHYTDRTFSELDYALHDKILQTYGYADRRKAVDGLQVQLLRMQAGDEGKQVFLFGLAGITILMLLFLRRMGRHEFLLITLTGLWLLLGGLFLPMIDIDARIAAMQMTLLGETVAFSDQVLYFKSKSILEVVDLMLRQGKADIFAVGILVLLFSVIFPLSKLIASMIYAYRKSAASNRFVRFLVFRTGKWSMADVMVIAIFMAYIGFSGIISEQLKQLEEISQNVEILTTNQSTLQIGFFLFTTFVIISLLIAHRLPQAFSKTDQ